MVTFMIANKGILPEEVSPRVALRGPTLFLNTIGGA